MEVQVSTTESARLHVYLRGALADWLAGCGSGSGATAKDAP